MASPLTSRGLFAPGTVVNRLEPRLSGRCAVLRPEVTASVPSRVDTYLLRHDMFESPPRPQVYPVGALTLAVSVHNRVAVRVRSDLQQRKHVVLSAGKRALVIQHTLKIMADALATDDAMEVELLEACGIRHAGLGSTAAVQTAVAAAVNHIYGDPIPVTSLVKYLAQNYGEEAEDGEHLVPMPSIGCAAAVGMLGGAALIVGESHVAAQAPVPQPYRLVLGIAPVQLPDANQDYYLYEGNYENMRILGTIWGPIKEVAAEKIIKPAIDAGDMRTVLACINSYTFGAYGDILGYFGNRWRFARWPFAESVYSLLKTLCPNGAYSDAAVFVSSGGPGIAALTANHETAIAAMRNVGITNTYVLNIDNDGVRFSSASR